jgi:hypothetical protein
MHLLESTFNPEASTMLQKIEQGREILLEQANFALFSGIVIDGEPSSFDEAGNHDDLKARRKWQDAIKKELCDMDKQQVWEINKKEDIPENRRTINYKWMFKIKQNKNFRARLVACGYSRIPGIDFDESFAPVTNDVSFQIMLIARLIWNLEASIVDVETAYLHGELQEEIYMNIPGGMSYDSNHGLPLKKTIYGLVQSAREFYKS